MTDYNIPPKLNKDHIVTLLMHMQPEDAKRFNEYCMIHFPRWLFKIIKKEAQLCDMSFEEFVRIACFEIVKKHITQRAIDENSD